MRALSSAVGPADYSMETASEAASRYAKIEALMPRLEWAAHEPYVASILDWKARRNAIILAHNYQRPEIFHGVADLTGDSLALARQAVETDADVIVLCGVHFMAETAKLLNPEKTVLIPDPEAGCSLASSIRPEDVRLLRERYPGVPVVTYVNTTAAVKAECDVCCTSANAARVVDSLAGNRVIFLPDEFLARHVAGKTGKEVIVWKGHCEVHERFSAKEIREYREMHDGIRVLAHPECPPEVLSEADYVGSTSGLIEYVANNRPRRVVLVTECSMSDNVSVEFPDVEFVRPCNLCPHMNRISLPKILRSLREMLYPVEIDSEVAARARRSVQRMMDIGRGKAN